MIDKLVSILSLVLPSMLMAYFFGYRKGSAKASKYEEKLSDTVLELEKRKNAEIIANKYAGMSDDDVIESEGYGASDKKL